MAKTYKQQKSSKKGDLMSCKMYKDKALRKRHGKEGREERGEKKGHCCG